MRWRIVALAFVALTVAAGFSAYHYASQRLTAPGPLAQPREVVIPRGSPAQAADALAQAGVIGDGHEFYAAALLTRGEGSLHAAEFSFPAHASLRQVLTILRTAKPVQHLVTIPEGLTSAQIFSLLQHTDALTGEAPLPEEGAVLPQSYAYERGASRASIIERAEAAMQHTLATVWAKREEDLPLASPQELLVLASIVERETARPAERPLVAAVFLNRLRKGMKLQSDPTVAFAISGGVSSADRALTHADLDAVSPYNTYRISGLPPGPIGSPGLAALQAVGQPAQTDFLYFVADGAGGHVFATTLEEHNRNVAHWRAGTAPAAP
jgi:UPF0755 protein